jgi:hypothetical protein
MAARKPKKPAKEEWERRRKEDAVMAILAPETRKDPSLWYRIEPKTRDAMLHRFDALLAKEQARRPAYRPAEISAGAIVALLHSAGKSEQAAIRLVMKMRKLKQATVAQRCRATPDSNLDSATSAVTAQKETRALAGTERAGPEKGYSSAVTRSRSGPPAGWSPPPM